MTFKNCFYLENEFYFFDQEWYSSNLPVEYILYRSLPVSYTHLWQLGKNDFKNRFANTSLGSIWGFLQPFIFMITYVIVFQYILKTGSAGNDPYIVWFLPGMAMWLCINAVSYTHLILLLLKKYVN